MLWMPTSKVTRVRSDGFSKISASEFAAQRGGVAGRVGLDVRGELQEFARFAADSIRAPVSRSFDNKIGAASVVAVILFTSQ